MALSVLLVATPTEPWNKNSILWSYPAEVDKEEIHFKYLSHLMFE